MALYNIQDPFSHNPFIFSCLFPKSSNIWIFNAKNNKLPVTLKLLSLKTRISKSKAINIIATAYGAQVFALVIAIYAKAHMIK